MKKKEQMVSKIMKNMSEVSTDDQKKYEQSKLIKTEAEIIEKIIDFSTHKDGIQKKTQKQRAMSAFGPKKPSITPK